MEYPTRFTFGPFEWYSYNDGYDIVGVIVACWLVVVAAYFLWNGDALMKETRERAEEEKRAKVERRNEKNASVLERIAALEEQLKDRSIEGVQK